MLLFQIGISWIPKGLSLQAVEASKDSNAKRNKPNKGEGNENGQVKAEEESKGRNNHNANDEKQSKSNSKPPEPPKDYIHVRATRGQATNSHSLAKRVRKESLSFCHYLLIEVSNKLSASQIDS